MEKEQFEKNLQEVYNLSLDFIKELGNYFVNPEDNNKEKEFISDFLRECDLEINEESIHSASVRLVMLRDTSLEKFMEKNNHSQEEIEEVKQKAYQWVREFYEKRFERFLSEAESKNLLTDFYMEILKGVHETGLEFNKLQPKWISKLKQTNSSLEKDFSTKEEIISFLKNNNLFDKGYRNEFSERAYSMLVKDKEGYKVKTYPELFPEEINNIVSKLEKLKQKLSSLEDNIYNQKQNYLDYLDKLISALSETNRDKLASKWSEVDEAWLKITSPFQINHPFEDYDDPYRNTVSIEWDLRIPNPELKANKRKESVLDFYESFFEKFGKQKYKNIYEKSKENLSKVQLYIGEPILYYSDNLNGLPSAQVIPNDEEVSNKAGKKIFAFPDSILIEKQASPFMLLPKKVFEEDFVKYSRNMIYNEEGKWKEIYDIQTIGHECGHILWKDSETESKLNVSGNYSYIEEFKASATSLAAFFKQEKQEIKKDVIYDTIKRAVSLISWMELTDRKPYYCEALIDLHLLFETGVIHFDGDKLRINLTEENYEKFKKTFLETYEELAEHYLNKKDASEFLFKYVEEIQGNYLPKKKYIRDFAEHYYKLYKEFGNQIDKEDSKENYIKK